MHQCRSAGRRHRRTVRFGRVVVTVRPVLPGCPIAAAFLFLMDSRRLPDRIPLGHLAVRAAWSGSQREFVPFARHRHDFFVTARE